MKDHIKSVVCSVAVCSATVVLGFSGMSALAADSHPDLVENGPEDYSALLTRSELESRWSSIVASYPEELPDGETFPKSPAFFFPEKTEGSLSGRVLYEEGLAESLLTRYWRCSWIEAGAGLVGTGAPVGSDRAAVAAASSGSEEIAPVLSEEVPMLENQTVDSYNRIIVSAADDLGVGVAQYEYDTECLWLAKQGEN